MSNLRYCELCKRNVEPVKQFNWLVFIFLCGIFYLPFYFLAKPKCPICNTADMLTNPQSL